MDAAGIDYHQEDNCFISVSEPIAAQKLFDQQLRTDWSAALDELLVQAHPLAGQLGKPSRIAA
jgi:hypothetical protein